MPPTSPSQSRPPQSMLGRVTSSRGRRSLVEQVERGLPISSLDRLASDLGVAGEKLAQTLRMSPRVLVRRREAGRLDERESDKLLRLAMIFDQAVALFGGNVEGAREWLTRPCRGLGYVAPLEYARTDVGAHEVEMLIGRLEHGVIV